MIHARFMLLFGLLMALGCGGGKGSEGSGSGYGPPVAGLNLITPRNGHTGTLLKDGRILVTGGGVPGVVAIAQAEVVDPIKNQVVPLIPMSHPRSAHTATLLPDGRVLIAGGQGYIGGIFYISYDSAEIFDPATGRFELVGSMAYARHGHTATLLKNGNVLIAGGDGPNPDQVWRAGELFDPATGRFEQLQQGMKGARTLHSATLLDSGKVLIAGGVDWSWGTHDTAELFDPESKSFSLLSSTFPKPFAHPDAVKLSSGRVLFILGQIAEIFDPATNGFSSTGAPLQWKLSTTSIPIGGAGALLLGGVGSGTPRPFFASIEKYRESTGLFESAGSLAKPRDGHTAHLLEDGRVLVIGGTGPDYKGIRECELVNPN